MTYPLACALSSEQLDRGPRTLKSGKRLPLYLAIRATLTALSLVVPLMLTNALSFLIVDPFTGPLNLAMDCVRHALTIALTFLAFRWAVGKLSPGNAQELSVRGGLAEFGLGGAIPALSVLGLIAALSLSGNYSIKGSNGGGALFQAAFTFIAGAFVQEMIFRVALFGNLERRIGTIPAMLASALVFSVSHAANPGIRPVALIGLFAFDLLFSAAFVQTRRIWLVLGMHAAWNFLQDGVFGLPNSGVTSHPSFFIAETGGPALLSGGAFGLEASLPAIALALTLAALGLFLAKRYGLLLSPSFPAGKAPSSR